MQTPFKKTKKNPTDMTQGQSLNLIKQFRLVGEENMTEHTETKYIYIYIYIMISRPGTHEGFYLDIIKC